jgi:hypothetical protein
VQIADRRDALAADPDVRAHGRCALAIEHRAAGDEQVVRLLRRRTCACGSEEEWREQMERGCDAQNE